MKLLKQAMAVLGTVTTITLLIAVLAPKSARAVVAALVQIVPGTTTHLGQNESQLVALTCAQGQSYCLRESPSGGVLSLSPFVVPAGYTLIVTDYNWFYISQTCPTPGGLCPGDKLLNLNVFAGIYSSMVEDVVSQPNSSAFGHQHFNSGVRIASGVTLTDNAAESGVGASTVLGYPVPN